MMDLGKIRKALDVALREHNDLMLQADLPTGSKIIEEALAELEKPAEDDIKELAFILEGWNRAGWSFEHIAHDLVSYFGIRGFVNAESYHAKKCEEVLISAADRAMAVYARDCEGCSPRLSDDCDERCPYIAKIRKAIMEAPRA
jgi:hypothetical protein